MINWFNLGANTLWVIGCPVVPATLSDTGWEASLFRQKLAEPLKQQSALLSLNIRGC